MKHIKHLIIAIGLLTILATSPANSAIVYSGKLDIEGTNFSIDINNDGSNDFVTKWRTWAVGNGFSQTGFDAEMNFDMRFINTELFPERVHPGAKAPLDYGELIGPTPPQGLLWAFNSNDAMMWITHDMWNDPFITYSGVWHDVSDKYIGFEMSVGSDPFYGWIQLDTDASNNVILLDYAYEDVPGTSIRAGATPVPLPATFHLLFPGVLMVLFRTKRCKWEKWGQNLRLTLVVN